MKEQEKFDRERNRILKTFFDDYLKNIENKKKNKKEIISIVISFFAVLFSIFVPIFLYKKESFNESLVLSSEIEIKTNDSDEGGYVIEFDIKQGGIKKAYTATVLSDDSINYESILQYSYGKTIKLIKNSNNEEKEINISSESFTYTNEQKNKVNGFVEIEDIENFALVLLDTTEQWWIYYFISTPEIKPINSIYCLKILDENNEIIASFEKEPEVQEMGSIIIDGSLTSVVSITEAMTELKTDYYFFKTPQSFAGKNGEKFTSNPIMENIYDLPSAIDIYNNILKIRDDIKSLSL